MTALAIVPGRPQFPCKYATAWLVITLLVAIKVQSPPNTSGQTNSGESPELRTIAIWSESVPTSDATTAECPVGKLYLLAAEVGKHHPLLVICPGGGYGGLAVDHEGIQIARWANGIGMSALVCHYRHRGQGVGHPTPMHDAQRSLRLARAHAADWGIDPTKVGILGFSAGGHLASTVLTHFDSGIAVDKDPVQRQSCRPDFGILCYPVIGFGKPYTHLGSQHNLLGENPDPELVKQLSNEEQVTAQTPPTFLWHTYEDSGVLPQNSIQFYLAMVQHGVPGELHVFEKGVHGVGLGGDIPGTREWSNVCANWLRVRGIL